MNVSNFNETVLLLESIGCKRKSLQESKRELWRWEDVEIMIDTWPFLETYVEVEGPTEKAVKRTAKIFGFNYKEALFGTVNDIYELKYGKTLDELKLDVLSFNMINPFLIDNSIF